MEISTSHNRTSGQLSVLRRLQALATDSFRMRRDPGSRLGERQDTELLEQRGIVSVNPGPNRLAVPYLNNIAAPPANALVRGSNARKVPFMGACQAQPGDHVIPARKVKLNEDTRGTRRPYFF
jgi:hypothetical protein